MKRLWDVEHPCYWQEGCYHAKGHHHDYDTWRAFLEEWDDADEDHNLVVRWDWVRGEDWGLEDGQSKLRLGYVMQRKAYTFSAHVRVTPEDEPAVRAWLEGKWRHMQRLWAPLAETKP